MADAVKTGVVAFVEEALPKSNSGRRGTPLDVAFADSIVTALREFDSLDVDGTRRPRALGSPVEFDTQGKASSTGGKYKDYIADKLGKKVKVRVYSKTTNEKGERTAPFFWQVYVPLTESATAES